MTQSRRKAKSPWPTKAAMTQVYMEHLWGGTDYDFYSGEGSHHPKFTAPYIQNVSEFLKSKNNELTVCDLGCGDFNVGRHLIEFTKKYQAIDIVESLIDRNKTKFRAQHLEFKCLDIASDDLPAADCVLLRQVLQHLSNSEITSILNKLSNYKYVIVTEHLPNSDFTPNKDIISGQGIRLKYKSGVDLLAKPFNLKVAESKTLCNIILDKNKGRIETVIYKLF